MPAMLIRDVRLSTMDDLEETARASAPPARCLVCERKLPRGLQRSHCLEHSPYAQELIRKEQRRRARHVRVRRAA